MTEPTETSEVVLASFSPEDVPEERTADDGQQQPKNREERYRKEPAALKAENDSLRARLETRDRADVERLASQHLTDPLDFWRDGATLEDVLTDGEVDAAKVEDAAKAIVSAHKHWRKLEPAAPPASTVTANGKIHDGHDAPTWSDVLRINK